MRFPVMRGAPGPSQLAPEDLREDSKRAKRRDLIDLALGAGQLGLGGVNTYLGYTAGIDDRLSREGIAQLEAREAGRRTTLLGTEGAADRASRETIAAEQNKTSLAQIEASGKVEKSLQELVAQKRMESLLQEQSFEGRQRNVDRQISNWESQKLRGFQSREAELEHSRKLDQLKFIYGEQAVEAARQRAHQGSQAGLDRLSSERMNALEMALRGQGLKQQESQFSRSFGLDMGRFVADRDQAAADLALRQKGLEQGESQFGRSLQQEALRQDRAYQLSERGLEQDESQFDRSLTQEDFGRERDYLLRERALEQDESQFGRTQGLDAARMFIDRTLKQKALEQDESQFGRSSALEASRMFQGREQAAAENALKGQELDQKGQQFKEGIEFEKEQTKIKLEAEANKFRAQQQLDTQEREARVLGEQAVEQTTNVLSADPFMTASRGDSLRARAATTGRMPEEAADLQLTTQALDQVLDEYAAMPGEPAPRLPFSGQEVGKWTDSEFAAILGEALAQVEDNQRGGVARGLFGFRERALPDKRYSGIESFEGLAPVGPEQEEAVRMTMKYLHTNPQAAEAMFGGGDPTSYLQSQRPDIYGDPTDVIWDALTRSGRLTPEQGKAIRYSPKRLESLKSSKALQRALDRVR